MYVKCRLKFGASCPLRLVQRFTIFDCRCGNLCVIWDQTVSYATRSMGLSRHNPSAEADTWFIDPEEMKCWVEQLMRISCSMILRSVQNSGSAVYHHPLPNKSVWVIFLILRPIKCCTHFSTNACRNISTKIGEGWGCGPQGAVAPPLTPFIYTRIENYENSMATCRK